MWSVYPSNAYLESCANFVGDTNGTCRCSGGILIKCPKLAPLDEKEQHLYLEPPPDVRAPHPA